MLWVLISGEVLLMSTNNIFLHGENYLSDSPSHLELCLQVLKFKQDHSVD